MNLDADCFRLGSFTTLLVFMMALCQPSVVIGKAPASMPRHVNGRSEENSAASFPENLSFTQDATDQNTKSMAHGDHKPKHGGAFFMALDNEHHLEGVLLPPGTFRIYLYDARTNPLHADQMKQVTGTIQVGKSEDAPKMPLGPGKMKETMEVALGSNVKFPVAVTLLLHLPGMAPDARPELFNFTFSRFTDENGPGASAPTGKMPGMK